MVGMDKETITAVALGIGLAASAGFRVFVPMLAAAIGAHLGVLPVHEGFEWLAGWPAIVCLGTATVLEIIAYYVPVVDNLLDTITTPMAIGAGTLLLTSVLPIDNNLLRWTTGLIVGGGMAATVQSGTVLTRLASTAKTAGIGNPVVATGEHAAAFGSSILSFVIPVIVAVLFLGGVVTLAIVFGRKLFRRKIAA